MKRTFVFALAALLVLVAAGSVAAQAGPSAGSLIGLRVVRSVPGGRVRMWLSAEADNPVRARIQRSGNPLSRDGR